jgi:predicted RNase H-like HicB family nuclease
MVRCVEFKLQLGFTSHHCKTKLKLELPTLAPMQSDAMTKYLIIVEKTGSGFSAYCPDIDGCVATGATESSVEKNMREAMKLHLEGMEEEGWTIPDPQSYATYLEITA